MNPHVSCDTSLLLNFLKIDRVDLLEKCSHSFFITDHVHEEITLFFPKQRLSLEAALLRKGLQKTNIDEAEEFAIFGELSKSRQLGAGECAAIAIATHRNYYLAIDDNQAIKKAAKFLLPQSILRTHDLMLLMIQEHLLTADEADNLIKLWATEHRFKLNINSFSELLK